MSRWTVFIPIAIALALWAFGIIRLSETSELAQPGTMGQPCRPTAAQLASAEIAGPGREMPAPPAVRQPVISTELVALAGDNGVPLLLPSLVIRMPKGDKHGVDVLLGTSLAEINSVQAGTDQVSSLDTRNTFRAQLSQLLFIEPRVGEDFGLFPHADDPDSAGLQRDVLEINDAPELGLGENGTVTLVIPQRPKALADNEETFAGGWTVSSSGGFVTFRIKGQLAAGTAWDVNVCTSGLPIVSADMTTPRPITPVSTTPMPTASAPRSTPSPGLENSALLVMPTAPPAQRTPKLVSQDRDSVHWAISPNAEVTEIEMVAVAQTSPAAAVFMQSYTDANRTIATVLTYVIPVTLLLAGLALTSRAEAMDVLGPARVRYAVSTVAIVRLAIAALLTFILVEGSSNVAGNGESIPVPFAPLALWVQQADWEILLAIGSLAIVVLGLVNAWPQQGDKSRPRTGEFVLGAATIGALAASFIYLEWLDLPARVIRPVISPVILVAAYSMLLVTAIRLWRERAERTNGPWLRLALPATGAVSILLCVLRLEASGMRRDASWNDVEVMLIPVWVTSCFIAALALLTFALLPTEVIELVPARVRQAGRLSKPIVVALLVPAILLLVIGQWFWAIFSQQTIWWRALVEASPFAYFPEVFHARFYRVLPSYPRLFYEAIIGLLLPL